MKREFGFSATANAGHSDAVLTIVLGIRLGPINTNKNDT